MYSMKWNTHFLYWYIHTHHGYMQNKHKWHLLNKKITNKLAPVTYKTMRTIYFYFVCRWFHTLAMSIEYNDWFVWSVGLTHQWHKKTHKCLSQPLYDRDSLWLSWIYSPFAGKRRIFLCLPFFFSLLSSQNTVKLYPYTVKL